MFPVKRVLLIITALLLIAYPAAFAQENQEIYFFYGNGCPHCAVVEQYFEDNNTLNKFPIEKKEIYSDRENAVFYSLLMDKLGVSSNQRGVPTLVVEDKVIVGDKPIIEYFEKALEENPKNINPSTAPETLPKEENPPKLDLTVPAVVAASVVDAINPCAFAVLIILMTTILASGDSKKALKSGIAFSASIFLSYFLMGLGLYSALGSGDLSGTFYKFIGWLAIILGLLNLKDYFWYGKGFLMEVPMSWRPRLKKLIGSVTSPGGAFSVGFFVSLFLLPCTSGPYIVILGMLSQNVLFAKALTLLVLYNLIFVTPMLLITFAVYKGFDPKKAEEMRQKRLQTLHLIAGIIMLIMGFIIVTGRI